MPNPPPEAMSAVGAVFAALIAGTISLLGLVISKEHKVSEFRQAWNDALREDVALLVTHLECLRGAAHAARPNRASWGDRKDHFIAVNRAVIAIRLRVALEDIENASFLDALTNLEEVAQTGDIATSELIGPAIDKLTEECRTIVRREWALIKKGEGVYLWSRYGAITVICSALVLLAAFIPAWLKAKPVHQAAPQSQADGTAVIPSTETKVYVFMCGSVPLNKTKSGLIGPCEQLGMEPHRK